MFKRSGLLVAILMSVLVLNGCGKNAVYKEDAAMRSSEMQEVLAQSRKHYDRMELARTDAILRLVASGPDCRLEDPIAFVIENDQVRCLSSAERDGFDIVDGRAVPRRGRIIPEGASRWDAYLYGKSSMAALETIAVLAEFQSLVAHIVDDAEFTTGDRLNDFVARTCTLSERLGGALSECSPTAGDASTKADSPAAANAAPQSSSASGEKEKVPFAEERNALVAVIDLILVANKDKKDVVALRNAYGVHGKKFSNALDFLLRNYRDKDVLFQRVLDTSNMVQARDAVNDAMAALPSSDVTSRYKLLSEYVSKERVLYVKGPARDPLVVALEELIKADTEFQTALLNGELTPEMRQRIAKNSFDQMKAWLRALKTLTSVF